MKKKISAVLNVCYSLLLIIIAMLIIISFVARVVAEKNGTRPNLFGITPTIVVSGSMLPEIQINSLNLIKSGDIEDVKIGDIIVYWSDVKRANILHRAIEKTTTEDGELAFITKGDANDLPDSIYVTENNFVGTVIYTANWTSSFLGNVLYPGGGGLNYVKLAQYCAIGIVLLWLFLSTIYCLLYILKGIIFRHRTGRNDMD